MMRIVSPVRLSVGPEEVVSLEIKQTRRILEDFRKAGFQYAVWVVDRLPKEQREIVKWTDACLDAFPLKAIIAMDLSLEGERFWEKPGSATDEQVAKDRGKSQEMTAKDNVLVFLRQVLPKTHSVILNYERLNNETCATNLTEAIAAVRNRANLARQAFPNAFVWLRVEEHEEGLKNLDQWTTALDRSVNGFSLYRWHDWSASQVKESANIVTTLLKSGKPILRGGFRYVSASMRPGIEKDLLENYRQRIALYEKWIRESGYAGYDRGIGEAIPAKVSVNMNLIFGL